MAEPRDDRVSSAYREMPGGGPTRALDDAIQAAARRAVGSRPGGARRWQIPVSIAAVLALAVGISLQIDREKPIVADGTPVSSGSAEYPVPEAAPEKEERAAPATQFAQPAAPPPAPLMKEAPRMPAQELQAVPEAKRFAPDPPRAEPPVPATPPAAASMSAAPPTPASMAVAPPAPASMPAAPPAAASMPAAPPAPASVPARKAVTAPSLAPAPANIAAPPVAAGAPASADAARAATQAAPRAKSELARETTAQEQLMSDALETPERRLERIAVLRAKGLHDEADRALAEFRRAYPGYRLSEEWQRKVERR